MRLLSENEIPKQLLEIPQPPKRLYIEGVLPDKGSLYLCIVGSRRISNYGRDVLDRLISGLSGYPIVIVSGLALGTDAYAHELALKHKLTTVAFPGSGLSPKVIVPSTNRALARRILESGGCLISEFPPEHPASHWTFPQRNRLMAGISRATLITEAEDKSGTLITARLALDYNRDLLVVPGSILSETSVGTNSLLRLGATPITKSEDILMALGFEINESARINREIKDCSPEEQEVLEFLTEPISRDDLIRAMEKPVSEANSILSIMEIKGLIKEELGEIRRI